MTNKLLIAAGLTVALSTPLSVFADTPVGAGATGKGGTGVNKSDPISPGAAAVPSTGVGPVGATPGNAPAPSGPRDGTRSGVPAGAAGAAGGSAGATGSSGASGVTSGPADQTYGK